MRLAFADPPYLGCCQKYGHDHGDDGRCWNDVETHRLLLERLAAEFDGWAYCMSTPSLDDLFAFKPVGARMASWQKPWAAFKANVRIAYTWEPVLFVPGRDSSADGAPVGRDHLSESITMRRGFTGAKPERFCRWILVLLGYVDGDELIDLFPGTGVMGRVLTQGSLLGPYQEPDVQGELLA